MHETYGRVTKQMGPRCRRECAAPGALLAVFDVVAVVDHALGADPIRLLRYS